MADVPGKFIILCQPFWAQYYSITGTLQEFDSRSRITEYKQHLSTLSRTDHRRSLSALALALEQYERFKLSNQREDIDGAIVHLTESIHLLPLSSKLNSPAMTDTLSYFARQLLQRSEATKQPENVVSTAKFLFQTRDRLHQIPSASRHRDRLTEFLVHILALQVALEAGNVMQNVREMAVLSRELLTLDTSDINTSRLICLLYEVTVSKRCRGVSGQPLDELIECLRVTMKRRPDLLQSRAAFAICLGHRYRITGMDDDCEVALPILDEIGNSQDKYIAGFATGLAAALAMIRSEIHWTPEYLEEGMYRTRTWLSSSSYTEFFASKLTFNTEVSGKYRLRYFGSIEGVEEPSGPIVSWSEMPESDETLDRMKPLLAILNDGDPTKIDEAIKKGRSIAASSHKASVFNIFCELLYNAFVRTNEIKYLNESIRTHREMFDSSTLKQAERLRTLPRLSRSFIARFQAFPSYRTQDVDEALELISKCVNNSLVYLPDRLWVACMWADFTRSIRHPSVSSAYDTALSLLQDTLHFSPTLQLKHTNLAMDDVTYCLPLDYASYRVDQNQLEEAIETLESGRALLWSEMRHLRVSIDPLLEVDPDLGREFAAVNRSLEELTKSVPPSHKLSPDDGAADNLRAVDSFGRLLLKQRNLLKERFKLISQIRSLPGFDGFLVSPPFDTLRSAASSGPVIIINHSRWRSDILILLHDMPPSLIPTPHDFYDRATAFKDKLLDSRCKHGLDSTDYDNTLAYVLAELYNLVGQPVIDRLRQLQVPEQSRVWWCPTSVFGSLPLHAMGPIPSDDGEPRYLLDLYICSYTPTLDALIQSRHQNTGSRSSDRPSVLLVAQLDPSLPTVGGEIQVFRALNKATDVSSLVSEAATPTAVIDSLHHHQFVHFACHGTLEAGKPFEVGFELHGGARLTILDIVRAHLPAAEFAFLSACHTAEVTEGSIMDEGLHLAAAVQYCGFRSVVGTMWAMADIDGRDLAKYFYKELFSDSRGMPYHERSAKALQFAVKKLRKKRGITLERWVNFVHYGA
jgi:CHAT domain-containing protein